MVDLRERGMSPQAEMKPFSEVTPMEIAQRLNIRPDWIDNYHEDGVRVLNLDAIGVNGLIQFGGDDKSADRLKYFDDTNHSFDLGNSEVILSPNSVTLVNPVNKVGGLGVNIECIKWIKLTSDGMDFAIRRMRRRQWPADVTPDILRAAGNAAARLQTVNSA